MAKPNQRQILIVIVMLGAILYGAYDFFLTGRKGSATGTAKQAIDMNALIAEMTSALAKETASPADAYIIKRAESPWPRDPFYERKSYRQLTAADKPAQSETAAILAVEKRKFNYTGYLDMGSKKIAIVNGSEYAAGDALDVDGYIINGIYPDRVAIYHRETRRTLDIPLQE